MINSISLQHSQFSKSIETLCSLPLFLGISRSDMETILGTVKFDFRKIPSGKIIYHVNDINQHVNLLLQGSIEASHRSYDNSIQFNEILTAPVMIGADVLFGFSPHHTHQYKTKSDTQWININKKEITSKLLNYEIFRLNLINHLSLTKQKQERMLFEPLHEELPKRFVQYLKHNFLYPAGPKSLDCRQLDLAKALQSSSRNIGKMLASLSDKKLLKSNRSHISIPIFENLIQTIL